MLSKQTKSRKSQNSPRPTRRGLTRLSPERSESVAVISQTPVSAPADLAGRFASILNGLGNREVGADALFETLKLEALDWGMDQGIDTKIVDTAEKPVAAESEDNH